MTELCVNGIGFPRKLKFVERRITPQVALRDRVVSGAFHIIVFSIPDRTRLQRKLARQMIRQGAFRYTGDSWAAYLKVWERQVV